MAPVLSKHKIACASIIILHRNQNRRLKRVRRKIWVKEWLKKRETHSHIALINELRALAPEDFKNYLRMDHDHFDELLELLEPLIERQDTIMRRAITVTERLAATLRFLATGRSYEDLKFCTRISPASLQNIIPGTCRALYKALKKDYMKMPTCPDEWKKIAHDFGTLWNFHNCIGAVDGKHIQIVAPANSGSYYWNYKNTFSIVLMGVVDANYKFIMVDVGKNGRVSDGGVLEDTEFYHRLVNDGLNLPDNVAPPMSQHPLPYVLVGDDAFALHTHFLKPYSRTGLSYEEKIFNYRLSRARRIVENAFGILVGCFRIFEKPINLKPETIDTVVLACCLLHNYLRTKARNKYTGSSYLDREDTEEGIVQEGEWRRKPTSALPLEPTRNRNPSVTAKIVRDDFKNYFNNEGSVPWQDNMVK